MDKKELDFEIRDTKRAVTELKLSGDVGALELAEADLKYFLSLK